MSADRTLIGGHYEMEALIGGGAIGSVYRGTDTTTGEKIAIKVLRSELIASAPELVERFRREGEALRRLNHPNIVKVLATLEEAGQHYIIMEYVGGGSLAELIRRQPKLPVEQVVAIGLELSDALSRAHHLEILHRDLKPANILLTEDGTPKLSDFGLARLGDLSALTDADAILGTLHYLSPEACYHQELDERTDIWAFGVVLFEMLTGQKPFAGETPFDILYAIKNQPLPDLSRLRPDIPSALVDLVRSMLRKDRPARLASTRQVGVELEAIQKALKENHPAQGSTAKPEFSAARPPQAAAAPKIRILIVDDHAVVRQGLRTFIDLQDDMIVIGEGSDGVEAVDLAGRLLPDIILLDLVMPQMDGIEATTKILAHNPQSRILILTSFGEDNKVFPAIRAGAQGYLLKDIAPNDLIKAIREAHAGKTQLHPEIAKKLMSAVAAAPTGSEASAKAAPAPAHSSAASSLTAREQEVLLLVSAGLSNREIAEKMIISEKTVKTHVSSILGKLGLVDRTQAAIWALKNGFGQDA